MDFKEQILTHFLWSLINLLPASSESEMTSNDPKINLMAKFEARPSSDFYDHSRWHYHVKAVDFIGRRMREEILEPKISGENGKAEYSRSFLVRNSSNIFQVSQHSVNSSAPINQPFISKMKVTINNISKSLENFEEELKKTQNLVKALKGLLELVNNLSEKYSDFLQKFSTTFSEESLEVGRNEKKEIIEKGKTINENWMFHGNGFKSLNNVTYNNQYQIGSLFIINRLMEEKDLKFNENKETAGEIFNEFTALQMKKLFMEILNNLKAEIFPQERFSIVAVPLSNKTDSKENLKDFPKEFLHQNYSSEQLSQMSKIVEFVERYHGAIDEPSPDWSKAKDDDDSRVRAKQQNFLISPKSRTRRYEKDLPNFHKSSSLKKSSSSKKKKNFMYSKNGQF